MTPSERAAVDQAHRQFGEPTATPKPRAGEHTVKDITAEIGPLFGAVSGEKPKYPMYSYERPAYALWQAVFEGLISGGYSEKQAVDWLQSKSARWALDGELGEQIRAIGFRYGADYAENNGR